MQQERGVSSLNMVLNWLGLGLLIFVHFVTEVGSDVVSVAV